MNIDELKNVVEEGYGLSIQSLEKVKNVYRIKTFDDDYCLKIIKYNFPHFYFILSAIKHLQNNGFDRVPDIIKKLDGADYISLDNSNAYLTKWVNARECNYDNPLDVSLAAYELGQLHNKSEGFKVTKKMQPRVYWYKWIEHFRTRKDEILDFKKRIDKKEKKSEFDCLYLSFLEEELKRADKAVENLIKSDYINKVKNEIIKSGFCHHDYAHHNVLVESSGRISIIDFDYCILDISIHDLASLIIRKMKNGKWDIDDALFIMESYSKSRRVEERDIPIMAAFMEFPQDYWQVGIQYYWEEQPWGEEFFIKKLKKIYEDFEEKQEFIEEFRHLKYSS
ncbi:CotS family spore coat protein [Clostridium sp. SYSU_GA19001]|uniref:CotS family spore coat protein n=1 Tax=Clostridium caldaquaticum TaxID=2940653 RepID=UPI0020779109|nr:CotS family spore coat protein [Clostridium caldaquaticum]MCM8709664.1 CotS family spore coat protein [Clostridium caldaquaticum]